MKKYLAVMCLMLIAAVMLTGCGDETTINNSGSFVEFNKTGTLQGKLIDAVTGSAIRNDSTGNVQMYLVQGTSDRAPDKLHTDPNDPLVGEYAFSGIPVQLNATNISYKVIVVRNGYQRFESADISFNTAVIGGSGMDSTYNWIRNIYLFPVGSTATAASIYVLSPAGKPVANATVVLQQNISTNVPTNTTSDRLAAGAGLVTTLNGKTDTTGNVVFPASDLVLGGSYTPVVLPTVFDNQQLATKTGTAFTIGTSNPNQFITMNAAGNGAYLYVISSSNMPKMTTSSGALSLKFNRSIAFASGTTAANMCSSTGNAAFTTLGALGTPTCNASISADGLTLTLTPNVTIAPTASGSAVTITTNLGRGIVSGDDNTLGPFSFENLTVNDTSSTVSNLEINTVQMIAR